jgi:calmodulin
MISASKELTFVMRAYGLNPSQSEISKYIKHIEKDPRGNISFKDFSHFMLDKMDKFDPPEDIIDAFRTFDMEEKVLISVSELRFILMNLGEKLSEQEMDELTTAARVNADGNIDYREFVKSMSTED